jgi:hypothetical protein
LSRSGACSRRYTRVFEWRDPLLKNWNNRRVVFGINSQKLAAAIVPAANHEYRSVPITARLPSADQMLKSLWLRIQSISHVFALTLTKHRSVSQEFQPFVGLLVEIIDPSQVHPDTPMPIRTMSDFTFKERPQDLKHLFSEDDPLVRIGRLN